VTDYYDPGTPSFAECAEGYGLTRASIAWFWSHYLLDPAEAANPLVAPLRAPDLSGLPPALVITAEYDPLRDEGEQYAERLRAAGVAVRLERYPGMIHGFVNMSAVVDGGRRALADVAHWLRERFAQSLE
jgi:acetyl esterase